MTVTPPPSTGRDFPDLRVECGELGTARWCVSTTVGGASAGEFAGANMAEHVGDDPRAVHANRRAFATGLAATRGLAVIRAEHGGRYAVVDEPGEFEGVDGLISTAPGVGLVALGADCAVVALHGSRADGSGVIAVAHCGWRGLVADIVGNVVAGVIDIGGAAPSSLQAVVGPAICGECYRVPRERCDTVRGECSPAVAEAAIVKTDTARDTATDGGVDITAGVRARLEELDVHCAVVMGCTREDERWYSLRRAVDHDGPRARTGRHALGIVLP